MEVDREICKEILGWITKNGGHTFLATKAKASKCVEPTCSLGQEAGH